MKKPAQKPAPSKRGTTVSVLKGARTIRSAPSEPGYWIVETTNLGFEVVQVVETHRGLRCLRIGTPVEFKPAQFKLGKWAGVLDLSKATIAVALESNG